MDNVIEVDFERLDELPIRELAARIRESSAGLGDEIRSLFADVRRDMEWYEQRLGFERRWRLRAERELRELRRLAFPFTDDEVDAALRRLYTGEPVRGGEVAAALVAEPTPSVRVRCGHSLSRLAAAGRVEKVKVEDHGESRNRWRPCDG